MVAMLTSDHKEILRELALYTTFLASALSPTAVPTFCELLFGCMLSGQGFVTQALLSINNFQCVWSSYHHWLSQGKSANRGRVLNLDQSAPAAIPSPGGGMASFLTKRHFRPSHPCKPN
ncbi:hypothetical protein [Endozoicomonas sp. Mp262]|uniref:hypothetical protein n=1 Tax=Endozoicomonas sp. Mp262 TaxID=2919499 RepID=UPI0021DA641C